MENRFARCQVLPLPDHQVSLSTDGVERTRWHFGPGYPRPFFYPFRGPSGTSLTRMGHPGAPNHDHHRSIWFAHEKVMGVNFWSDATDARIRQQSWLAYQDGDDEAVLAVRLHWYDGHDPRELVQQDLVAAIRPGEKDEFALEIQATFTPTADEFEFAKTNFGFFAVRVAASLSVHFGGGQLTSSNGKTGEPAIFGQRAAWMDYSGPVSNSAIEGITYFDHPGNPGFPSHWHVRSDGWMGASVCMHEGRRAGRQKPLVLRYLLHAHRGGVDAGQAQRIADEFARRPAFRVSPSKAPHRQFEVARHLV